MSNSKEIEKIGLPPGVLIHIGRKKVDTTTLTAMRYGVDVFEESTIDAVSSEGKLVSNAEVDWLNLVGLHDTALIGKLGSKMKLHSLTQEDVLNTTLRPKFEDADDYVYLNLKMLSVNKEKDKIFSEQVSLVLGEGWLLTFQEDEGDVFDALRGRLRNNTGKIRQKSADYLFYRLIDTVIDNYYYVLEFFSDATEQLESSVLEEPTRELLQDIQQYRRKFNEIRRMIYPLREALSSLDRSDTTLISKETRRYLRDAYEHLVQMNESLDAQREMLTSLTDLHMNNVSFRMNQVMQLLTVMSTIFIPLSFLTGLYGMNFEYIPELGFKYGYFALWGVIALIVVGMLVYFKRKKWM